MAVPVGPRRVLLSGSQRKCRDVHGGVGWSRCHRRRPAGPAVSPVVAHHGSRRCMPPLYHAVYVTAAVSRVFACFCVFLWACFVCCFVFAPSGVFSRVSGTAPAGRGGVVPVAGTTLSSTSGTAPDAGGVARGGSERSRPRGKTCSFF